MTIVIATGTTPEVVAVVTVGIASPIVVGIGVTVSADIVDVSAAVNGVQQSTRFVVVEANVDEALPREVVFLESTV